MGRSGNYLRVDAVATRWVILISRTTSFKMSPLQGREHITACSLRSYLKVVLRKGLDFPSKISEGSRSRRKVSLTESRHAFCQDENTKCASFVRFFARFARSCLFDRGGQNERYNPNHFKQS